MRRMAAEQCDGGMCSRRRRRRIAAIVSRCRCTLRAPAATGRRLITVNRSIQTPFLISAATTATARGLRARACVHACVPAMLRCDARVLASHSAVIVKSSRSSSPAAAAAASDATVASHASLAAPAAVHVVPSAVFADASPAPSPSMAPQPCRQSADAAPLSSDAVPMLGGTALLPDVVRARVSLVTSHPSCLAAVARIVGWIACLSSHQSSTPGNPYADSLRRLHGALPVLAYDDGWTNAMVPSTRRH